MAGTGVKAVATALPCESGRHVYRSDTHPPDRRNRNIEQWFTRIKTRQIALPRFQRKVAWGPNLVADLVSTVLRGLPCGASLILEVGDELPFISRTMHGAPSNGERITELLLDGQQRLTALWRSMNNLYDDRTFLVHEVQDPNNPGKTIPEVIGITRYLRSGQKYPLWSRLLYCLRHEDMPWQEHHF